MEKEIAKPVNNLLVPSYETTDDANRTWLIFKYDENDKDPWKWPKVLKYRNRFFYWMSWNSDNHTINYKEIDESEIASIVKK
jgi:hypothetical protein